MINKSKLNNNLLRQLKTFPESTQITPLPLNDLRGAKAAYSTRRVPKKAMNTLVSGDIAPQSGDLVMAKITKVGQHQRIELGTGRRSKLAPGDRVILCYGNRYAPHQFEGYVPKDLGPCQMVAAGGIAAKQKSKHSRMAAATDISPLGLIGDETGRPLNLSDWSLTPKKAGQRPYTIAVVGTSMNAGKTTSVANLIRGLAAAGLRVGSAKITGTGSGGDIWLMRDADADAVFDFTDAGFASTFGASLQTMESIFNTLTGHLAEAGAEVIVLEIADGLIQQETSALLSAPWFGRQVEAMVFAAGHALGAQAGVAWLRQRGLPVMAVSGLLTASPLAIAETERTVDLPVLPKEQLASSNIIHYFKGISEISAKTVCA